MLPNLSKYLREKLRSSIGHQMLLRERWRAVHQDHQLHDPPHLVQIAHCSLQRPHQINRHAARRFLPLLRRDLAAELPRPRLLIFLRDVSCHEDDVARAHKRNISRCRRRNFRQRYFQLTQCFIDGHSILLKSAAVVFPPHTTTPTRSPRFGLYRPECSAANAAAPPGSATTRSLFHSASCASTISSSETNTTFSTHFCAIGNMISPTRFGASESAVIPPT